MALFSMALWGCASSIAFFDQHAYLQSTALKVDALSLMDSARENYAQHAKAVSELKISLEKAYEYELHRPKNEISAQLWAILKDPNKNLLGGFLVRWAASDSLSSVFIQEARGQVAEAFDIIADLESKKIKASDEKVSKLIND